MKIPRSAKNTINN